MAKTSKTVRQLAAELGMDVDDALLILWESGWDSIESAGSRIGERQTNTARRALGYATRRQIRTRSYWMSLLRMPLSEFDSLLQALGVTPRTRSDRLPNKAVSRLKKEARKRKIDYLTGAALPPVATTLEDRTPALEVDWRTIGHTRSPMFLLSDEDVRSIHFALVSDYVDSSDPISPAGVRTEHALGGAVHRCQISLGQTFKYPTVETSCAALVHALVLDHPFHNGNKRTALVSMLVACDRNGLFPTCNEDQLFKLVMQIARHQIGPPAYRYDSDSEVAAVAHWICKHTRSLVRGNRPLPWRTLRRILAGYDCKMTAPSAKIGITRTKRTRLGFLRGHAEVFLSTHVHFGGEGREISPGNIKRIREELQLDESHGVDAAAFYAKEPLQATDFIAQYRKTLDRLSRR